MKKEIQATIKQSFLEQYIQAPVDEEKLFVLIAIMNDIKLPTYRKVQYILAVTLIQTALDAHDLVRVKGEASEQPFSVQDQLTVLAGDYYSGLYYFLLSKIDDLRMVRQLATAIKDINEEKMALLYGDTETLHKRVQRLKRIETLLITRVVQHIGCEYIAPLAEEWVLAAVLIKEREDLEKYGKSKWFCGLKQSGGSFDRVSLIGHLSDWIDECLQYTKSDLPLRIQENMRREPYHSRLYRELCGLELNKEEG
ncbi:heptaprenyl diphosphate synthase component 1 [Lentibacillus sp. JNUCC-1]|uniref:heptaprenyl diphosphate synthase component 1 n=1 Tax=Lentibacillus sp. JNUCC-1 TaxID=2654513 RepID=UPI0018D23252|nr:heptaprenyl diphosphate synthase component 1 [Lentibacillus sp. JNUCC-1]